MHTVHGGSTAEAVSQPELTTDSDTNKHLQRIMGRLQCRPAISLRLLTLTRRILKPLVLAVILTTAWK